MKKIYVWTVVATLALPACAPAQAPTSVKQKPVSLATQPKPAHRVIIQVTQNDPGLMNMALNKRKT